MDTQERRALFPRGLAQPKQGYRFSLDSLLLASFARVPSLSPRNCGPVRGMDLGCGCGVVGLALLLAHTGANLHLTGLDIQEEMIEFAGQNSRELGLDDAAEFILSDVSSYCEHGNALDFALANPPYRQTGQGRVSPGPSRAVARFEGQAGLEAFCRCATRTLKDKAPLFLVHLPERLVEVAEACRAAALRPKRVRFVHSRADEPARIMLLEARKNGNPGLVVEPPLALYEGRGEHTRMTAEALAFCPFLQCNAET